MSFVTHTGLAAALRSVLGAKDSRSLTREWEIVLAALKHQARMQAAGDFAGDVVQAAAMRIMRAHKPFEAMEDGRAFKYLGTVVRRAHIDMVDKTRRHDPLDFVVIPGGDDDREPIDRVPAPDSDPARSADAPAAWDEIIDRLRGHIDEVIAAAALPPARRESAWLQSSATILAVLGKQGAREIAVALGAPEVSDASIYKWSERGRPWIERALVRWAQEGDEETDGALIAELRTQLLKRRKDAGRARPQRRRKDRASS